MCEFGLNSHYFENHPKTNLKRNNRLHLLLKLNNLAIMSTKTIRVKVYQNQPDKTVKLADNIIKKHDDLVATPGGSPLTGKFNTVLYKSQRDAAKLLRKEAAEADGRAQSLLNQCDFACGLAKGQNKQSGSTIYVLTLDIRDELMRVNRATPETTSEFGFEVVVHTSHGHRFVKIDIPDDSSEGLLDLADDIIEHHEELLLTPGGSPLTGEVDMLDYKTKVTAARVLLNDARVNEDLAQSKNNQAIVIIGYGEGQTAEVPDTLYWFHTGIRDYLLRKFEGTEEVLSEWGFEVVLGSHLSPGRHAQPVTPP
jgi:hypothetical protein